MYSGEFMTGMSKEMQSCMKMCMMTKNACENMMMMCMKDAKWMAMSGMNECMMALQCCVSMCDTACMMMSCDSDCCEEACGLCAKMCMMCAEACDKMKATDKAFKMCADMCRKCADMCKMMASH